jgi:hypothetical protein
MKTEEVAQDSNLRHNSGMPGPPARSTSNNAINRLRFGVLSRANANATSLPRTSSNGDDSNTHEQRREIAPSPLASPSSRISSRDAAESPSPQSSNRRHPTRGRKRNAPQPRAENSTSSLSEDRTTTDNRQTRRRMNSQLSAVACSNFEPSSAASEDRSTTDPHSNNRRTRRRTSLQLSQLDLFEPSSASSEDRTTTDPHSNNRRTRRRTSSQLSLFDWFGEPSSASMGESSTRGSLTGGSRGHSLFPFSSDSRVQQLGPLLEVSAGMEGPMQTSIDSVSAPTRVANTVSASSSPSTQSQSITFSRAMHITRSSTGRSEGEQSSLAGGARGESRFIPRLLERMFLPENITAEDSGRDERPAPFRRRTNVLVSMHRLQVLRPPLSGNDSIPNQGIQEDNSTIE